MEAEIVAIGTELLLGQVREGNAYFLSGFLRARGVRLTGVTILSDEEGAMEEALRRSVSRSELTIVTGGLGPTGDDRTKGVLLRLFGGELVEDARALGMVEEFLRGRGVPMSARNRTQALLPSSCEAWYNGVGTAPGMLFTKGGHSLVALPGVPHEMRWLAERYLGPWLEAKGMGEVASRTFHVAGIGESTLADLIAEYEGSLPEPLSLAYLPEGRTIRLRLDLLPGGDGGLLIHHGDALRSQLGEYCYGEGEGVTLASALGGVLREGGQTVATAESCTGGRVASTISQVEGASDYLVGSVVAYATRVKREVLGVAEELLDEGHVVSEGCALSMAEGARRVLGATVGIGTTGWLRPGSGQVWVAVSGPKGYRTKELLETGSRPMAVERVCQAVLNEARLLLQRG